MTIPFRKVAKRWMKDAEFREEYDALGEQFQMARILIAARARAGLSQTEVAQKMGTSQSTIARLESGNGKPTLNTLEKFAEATGMEVQIALVPKRRSKKAA